MLGQTPREQRQRLIDANHPELSLRRQCELLQVNRSTIYYKAAEIDVDDIDLGLSVHQRRLGGLLK